MNIFLTITVILLSSILSFLMGYSFRRNQEEKIKKKVWANIVKRLPTINPLDRNLGLNPETEESDLFVVESLENDLRIAIINENYEEAANIRDLLRDLGS